MNNNHENIRKVEHRLIHLTGLTALNGIGAVSLANSHFDPVASLVVVAIYLLALLANKYLCYKGYNGDQFLLPIALLLANLGLVMLYRLKPDLFLTQSIWVAMGLIGFLITISSFRNIERLAIYKYMLGIIAISFLIITIIFGVDIGGNKNWIIIGFIHLQPSEFAKIFIVFFIAAYLNERREMISVTAWRLGPLEMPELRLTAPLLVVWGISMLLLIMQKDLGSALLYYGTTLILIYLASGRLSYIGAGTVLFVIGALVCYKFFPHVQTRFDIWLDPWSDPNGKAFQIVQSLFALGSGGIWGSGLSLGKPQLIPEVHTDFIFAAIGEELGLLGSTAVLLIYILMIYRSFRIALASVLPFSILLAGGLASTIALQTFIIIAGVVKFLPLTGITLPFISYGGSSMISNFILLGILFSISEVKTHYDS